MATNITVELDPFKRGDTPTFYFSFSNPSVGFDWSTITLDAALTDDTAPTSNSDAAAIRTNQTLTTDSQGAHYAFTITTTESKALTVGSTYFAEVQLKQSGTSVATPITCKVKVLQDYVI